MLEFINHFRKLVSSKKNASIEIWPTFLVHPLTTLPLLLAVFVTGFKWYTGSPISCISTDAAEGAHNEAITSYCYNNLFLVLPGVDGFYKGINTDALAEKVIMIQNYKWITVILLIQCAVIFAPQIIWKRMECGKLLLLRMDLNDPALETRKAIQQRQQLLRFFRNPSRRNRVYFSKYFATLLLNILAAYTQFIIINFLTDDIFSKIGLVEAWENTAIRYDNRTDAMIFHFPSVTKCKFLKGGPSGNIPNYDVLCVIRDSPLHEQIILVQWLWFNVLYVFFIFRAVYTACAVFPLTRHTFMKFYTGLDFKMVKILSNKLNFGDVFILQMLSSNMDTTHFQRIVEELCSSAAFDV